MKTFNIAVALGLAALGWGYAQYRQVKQLAERLENTRSSHYRLGDQIRDQIEGLESDVRRLQSQLTGRNGGPIFTPETTIGDAIRLDPRVSQVLAAFHIGGCDSCAVSDADTLAYAAAGNGQEIEPLLTTLNRLNSPESSQVMEMIERKPNVHIEL